MDVTSFCTKINSYEGRLRSRLLIIPNISDYTTICANYGQGFSLVHFSEFVDADYFVPMPERAFALFEERRLSIRKDGKCVIVIGVDAYFELLDEVQVRSAFSFIEDYLNGKGIETVIFIFRQSIDGMDEVLKHPALRATNTIVEIDSLQAQPKVEVLFIGQQFAKRFKDVYGSLRKYLEAKEAWGVLSAHAIVSVRFNGEQSFGGISRGVRQLADAQTFLAEECGFTAKLSSVALRWIVEQTTTRDINQELQKRFFPGGVENIRTTVLSRAFGIFGNAEREVFIYALRRVAPTGSYLAEILRQAQEDAFDFIEAYINVPRGILFLTSDVQAAFAKERAMAIRTVDNNNHTEVLSAISRFIEKTKNLQVAIIKPWLNIGLDCEESEWIRRALLGDSNEERRLATQESRLLRAYLSPYMIKGQDELNAYFTEYRNLKCCDTVTNEFVEKAHDAKEPCNVSSRAVRLGGFRDDPETMLFVVDALGVEYLPFLIDRAGNHRLNIEGDAECVHVILPTSTPYNKVSDEWSHSERYEKFNEFDAVLHTSFPSVAEGIETELRIIDEEILPHIAKLLRTHKRVILTADHGATRLAVVARMKKMAHDIIIDENMADIYDWRYAIVHKSNSLNSNDLEEPTISNEKVAVVKGYNRLPKPGGPGFEMHGGATLEERLVPFVIFTQNSSGANFKQDDNMTTILHTSEGPALDTAKQMIEDSDFDI